MLLFQTVNEKMSEGSALTTQRLPAHPSAASYSALMVKSLVLAASQWFSRKDIEEINSPDLMNGFLQQSLCSGNKLDNRKYIQHIWI